MAHTNFNHPNATLYIQLMEQVRWRTDAVVLNMQMVNAKVHYLNNRLVAEFCLLQLRFCCELLALGCVAIHTDAPKAKSLEKTWNAEQIMKAFSEIKPKFFPNGIRSVLQENGVFDQQPAKGALTKDEFVKMYNFMGVHLHAGTLKNYKNNQAHVYDLKIIDEFVAKLASLLSDHTYLLNDGETMIRVIMNNTSDGRVWLNELVVDKTKSPPAQPAKTSP